MPLFGKKKFGPKPAKPGPKSLNDKHLTGTPQLLGANTANEVYKTQYKGDKSISGNTTGYFKEDTDQTMSKNAVGASSLARGIGLGHLIPETRFAKHTITGGDGVTRKGVTGAVSAEANGQALTESVWDGDPTERLKRNNGGTMPQDFEVERDYPDLRKKNGAWTEQSGMEINDIDLSAPQIQKGLNDLQWFDALIGNSDRHGGNILIDPDTNKVIGIDNDLTFGKGQGAEYHDGKEDESFTKGKDGKYLGLPSMIDQDMAAKLLAIDAKSIKKLLNPKGTPKGQKFDKSEIDGTIKRLTIIQNKVREMQNNGQVVANWDQNTYTAMINQDTSAKATSFNPDAWDNYAQRQHRELEKARDTDNPLMWRKGNRVGDTTPVPPQPVVQPPQPVVQQPVQQPVSQAPLPPPQSSKPHRPIVQPNNQRARPRMQPPLPNRPQAPIGVGQSSLSSRVLDTPWANDFKRTKPRVTPPREKV